ncbi:alpha-L-fucosidase [Bacteroidota bacterium]
MKKFYITSLVSAFLIHFHTACNQPEGSGIQDKKIIESLKYEPSWKSLEQYTYPEWFRDVKLGVFIHWGVYSVPAYGNEWYPRNMYRDEKGNKQKEFAHHHDTWGDQGEFGYKDFIPMFTAENFDANAWIDLFKKAGVKYVVPVAEHHDGFPLYDCSYTNWNAVNMGPKRNVIAELKQASEVAGMKFGVSTHRAFNWSYYTFKEGFDTMDPENVGLYGTPHGPLEPVSLDFLTDWHGRTKEIIDKFHPDVLWFDFGWHRDEFAPYRPLVTSYYYNQAEKWGKEVVLQYKDKVPEGIAVLDVERGKLSNIHPYPWQTDTSIGRKSWGFINNEDNKSANEVLDVFIDIVSKNGCLLINVGPKPDGTIPDEQKKVLIEIGKWMDINGEAIYETRPWKIFGEGPTRMNEEGGFSEMKNTQEFSPEDIRFTAKGEILYAIGLDWPGTSVTIKSLGTNEEYIDKPVNSVSLIGYKETIKFEQTTEGLRIELPSAPPSDHAYVLKID